MVSIFSHSMLQFSSKTSNLLSLNLSKMKHLWTACSAYPSSFNLQVPSSKKWEESLFNRLFSLSLSLKLFSQMACRSLFHVSPTSCFFKKPPLPLTDKLLHFLTASPKRACALKKLLHLAKKKEMITVPKNIGVYTSLSRLFHDTFW